MNRERLLNVARALRESPKPEDFTMECYGHQCGTPACALGHYAARRDLQNAFVLDGDVVYEADVPRPRCPVDIEDGCVLEHFGFEWQDACELFGAPGCGNARTAVAAAEYIERWVAARGGS